MWKHDFLRWPAVFNQRWSSVLFYWNRGRWSSGDTTVEKKNINSLTLINVFFSDYTVWVLLFYKTIFFFMNRYCILWIIRGFKINQTFTTWSIVGLQNCLRQRWWGLVRLKNQQNTHNFWHIKLLRTRRLFIHFVYSREISIRLRNIIIYIYLLTIGRYRISLIYLKRLHNFKFFILLEI